MGDPLETRREPLFSDEPDEAFTRLLAAQTPPALPGPTSALAAHMFGPNAPQ